MRKQLRTTLTLPLGGSKRIMIDPGQWLASKHVKVTPATVILLFSGNTCNLSHGTPILWCTRLAVIEEQYIFPRQKLLVKPW